MTVKYFHVRLSKHTNTGPAITFAWTYDEKEQTVKYSAAFCSKKDQFVKRMGRMIAENRLKKGYYDSFHMKSDNPKYSYPKTIDIVKEIQNRFEYDKIDWEKILKNGYPNSFKT